MTVQSPLSTEDLGPVLCLWEAAGVGDDERAVLGQRIRELASSEQAGGLALGVLIGLLATQLTIGLTPCCRHQPLGDLVAC